MLKRILIGFFVILLSITGYTQKIENIRQSVAQNKALIAYTLTGTHENESFLVEVFLVTETARVKLKLLEGDAGYNVTPGETKKILWDYNNELVNFEGEVSFEILANPIFYFEENKDIVRRGKDHNVNMIKSSDEPITSLYLLNSTGNKELIVENVGDDSKVNWKIPATQPVGTYKLQAETTAGTTINGSTFKIQRRIPNFVKALPAILAGMYIFYDRTLAPMPEPLDPSEVTGN